jgi:hypothetical protein
MYSKVQILVICNIHESNIRMYGNVMLVGT